MAPPNFYSPIGGKLHNSSQPNFMEWNNHATMCAIAQYPLESFHHFDDWTFSKERQSLRIMEGHQWKQDKKWNAMDGHTICGHTNDNIPYGTNRNVDIKIIIK